MSSTYVDSSGRLFVLHFFTLRLFHPITFHHHQFPPDIHHVWFITRFLSSHINQFTCLFHPVSFHPTSIYPERVSLHNLFRVRFNSSHILLTPYQITSYCFNCFRSTLDQAIPYQLKPPSFHTTFFSTRSHTISQSLHQKLFHSTFISTRTHTISHSIHWKFFHSTFISPHINSSHINLITYHLYPRSYHPVSIHNTLNSPGNF